MEFYDLVKVRASVRKFMPSTIEEDALMRILDAGRRAPSGCNMQNRAFVVIRNREILALLHDKVQGVFREAAAAIALVMDASGTRWGNYWLEDGAAATQNMLLAIVNEGYDSVWVEGTMRPHEDWLKAELDIPADRRIFALLPIGKAAKPALQAPKDDLESLVHFEKY